MLRYFFQLQTLLLQRALPLEKLKSNGKVLKGIQAKTRDNRGHVTFQINDTLDGLLVNTTGRPTG